MDQLVRRKPLSRSSLTRLAMSYPESPQADLVNECKLFSMLHQETLFVLNYAARVSRTVLEIGPYIGGSTVAIGDGLKSVDNPMHLIIEVGGAYAEHPQLPSDDILRDLKNRIRDYDLPGTKIFEGWSYDQTIVDAVVGTLGDRKIDLFFMDANGLTEITFQLYEPYLSADCIIVLDDYIMQEGFASGKQIDVRAWVSDNIDAGRVTDLGVYLWGTWAGQMPG